MARLHFIHCDLVVPLGYGLDRHRGLPRAEEQVLDVALHIAKDMYVPVAFVGTGYYFLGSEHHENELKTQYLLTRGLANKAVVPLPGGAHNTVDEAEMIREGYSGRRKVICVVCDRAHAWSARYIWERVFPGSKIIVEEVSCEWNSNNRALLERSRFLWSCACLARHLILLLGGIDAVRRMREPVGEG